MGRLLGNPFPARNAGCVTVRALWPEVQMWPDGEILAIPELPLGLLDSARDTRAPARALDFCVENAWSRKIRDQQYVKLS